MLDRAHLTTQISERQVRRADLLRQIDDAKRALDIVDAEIGVYIEIAALFESGPDRAAVVDHVSGPSTRMSDSWRTVIQMAEKRFPEPFTIDDVMGLSERNHLGLSRETVRSQLSTYTSRGWFDRVSNGKYVATQEGALAAGVEWSFSPEYDREDEFESGDASRPPLAPVPAQRPPAPSPQLPPRGPPPGPPPMEDDQ